MKYFIYVYDVDEPEGPFTFLPADTSFRVVAQGGAIEVLRGRGEDGRKVSGAELARAQGITKGTMLGG